MPFARQGSAGGWAVGWKGGIYSSSMLHFMSLWTTQVEKHRSETQRSETPSRFGGDRNLIIISLWVEVERNNGTLSKGSLELKVVKPLIVG